MNKDKRCEGTIPEGSRKDQHIELNGNNKGADQEQVPREEEEENSDMNVGTSVDKSAMGEDIQINGMVIEGNETEQQNNEDYTSNIVTVAEVHACEERNVKTVVLEENIPCRFFFT